MVYKPLSARFAAAMTVNDQLRSLAREQTVNALNVIIGIMNAETTSDRDKLVAANSLLDRGWGKPTQLMSAVSEEVTMRKFDYEIVHVQTTQEEIENDDLVVDYSEIKNGNGHDRTN